MALPKLPLGQKKGRKRNQEIPSKSQEKPGEKQGKQEARLVQGDLLTCLEISSHNQGKSLNHECFSMRFDVSIACYNKLGQDL